ncbi:hypothetical protein PsorP6_000763 [Peronosclerospora sorghi]|uniref:Uncharacterized protein n=1 Tax=Peronosclerospora sorghi TaxID=230839 RepID=A0ACC0WTN0_9STRA|nr:hypothetical protein PsorP6_000763 [Peronosclerospora sorghi]
MSLTPAKPGYSKTVSKAHVQDTDFLFIVSCMEDKSNFESVYGTSGQTKIGVPIKNKTAGLRDLATALSRQKHASGTSFGNKHRLRVTEEYRREDGIFTVEQKLNRFCAHFERIKALFGEIPAFQPLLIDDSLATPANTNVKDEEATGEVDVHHDETQLGDEMGESVCLCWERDGAKYPRRKLKL